MEEEKKENRREETYAKSFKEIFSSKENFVATVKQFVKFGLVGLMNTAISFAVVYICLGQGISIYIGNTLGWACGLVNAYLWNIFWVFKGQREELKKTIPKFFGTYLLTYLLQQLLTYLFVEVAGISQYVAPVLYTIITMFINFFLSKFWTFKR